MRYQLKQVGDNYIKQTSKQPAPKQCLLEHKIRTRESPGEATP